MKCPHCNHLTTLILETRTTPDNEIIWRRRKCEKCNKQFTTTEKLFHADTRLGGKKQLGITSD